jgi:hypothetical protein
VLGLGAGSPGSGGVPAAELSSGRAGERVDAGVDPSDRVEEPPGARSAEEQCHSRHELQKVATLFQDRYLMLGTSCSLDTMLGIFVLGSRSAQLRRSAGTGARQARPGADIARVFGGKPVGVIGATPGPGGTRLAQTAWMPVLRSLNLQPWYGKSLFVAGAGQVFDAQGKLVDATIQRLLSDYLAGFSQFVARVRG